MLPVHGGWTRWGGLGPCSASCGGGSWTRRRACTAPRPRNGGRVCTGTNIKTGTCNDKACPCKNTDIQTNDYQLYI